MARSRRSPASSSRRPRPVRVGSTQRQRQGRGPPSSSRIAGLVPRRERVEQPTKDGRHEGRHVAADDDDTIDDAVERREAGREAGERAFEGTGSSWTRQRRRARRGRHRARATTTTCGDGADRVDGMVEQRPAVDRLGELVAPEPRDRPPASTIARDPLGHGTARFGAAPSARDVAVRRPPQDRPSVEVLEDGHHVLAARPGRVAEGGRRQRARARPSPGRARRGRGTSTWRRRGPARGRRSGPRAPALGRRAGGQPATRAASARDGGAARRAAPRGGPSPRPGRDRGSPRPRPGAGSRRRRATSRLLATSPSMTASRRPARGLIAPIVTERRRVSSHGAADRRRAVASSLDGGDGTSAASARDIRREQSARPRTGAVEVEPRVGGAAVARERARPGRGLAPPRDPAWRSDVEDDPADRVRLADRAGGRSDRPARAPIGAASRTIPAARRRAAQGIASAPPDRRIDAAVPACSARACPVGDRPAGTRRAPGPWRRTGGSAVSTIPRWSSSAPDAGEVERRPSTAVDAVDGRPVDLDLADPHLAIAGHEPERVAAGERPAAERAGHDRAAALDREDPVDREGRRARPSGVTRPAGRRALRGRRPDPPRSRPTRRGPASRQGTSARGASATGRATAATRSGSTASTFVTTAIAGAIPSASSRARCSSVWARGPSSAATTSIAASISPAPTSMLPTSLSCPGTSTKSIDDAVVESEVGVADIDRHPAPPLLRQPVGVDAGQRPQQRRLAVIDVARPCRRRRSCARRRGLARSPQARSSSRPARPSAGRARPDRPRSGRRPMGLPGAARRARGRPSGPDRRTRPTGASAPGSEPPPTVDAQVDELDARRASATSAAHICAIRGARSGVAAVAIIRQTGISVVARPARYRPSVSGHAGHRHLVRSHRPGQRVAPDVVR